jgi:hypothetical protein
MAYLYILRNFTQTNIDLSLHVIQTWPMDTAPVYVWSYIYSYIILIELSFSVIDFLTIC